MKTPMRIAVLVPTILAVVCFSGCGGGGGGGGAAGGAAGGALTITSPDLTGKTGQEISVPVNVTGATVYTATFDVHFTSGYFDKTTAAQSQPGTSVPIAVAGDAVCRYKWLDDQTIKVMYASREGAEAGTVLARVPLLVLKEGASGITLQNVVINQ